jgi:hypothetical protein
VLRIAYLPFACLHFAKNSLLIAMIDTMRFYFARHPFIVPATDQK